MPSLLTVDNLSKNFGALHAIKDVSFALEDGEVLGIAGPNGSGKSTLFNILTKIPFGPDSGEVRLHGNSLKHASPRKIVNMGLLRIFQTETDFETLTVLENILVSLPEIDRKTSQKMQENRAIELLESMGLETQKDRIAAEITVYDRKRLMIATALACRPIVLLLDEPAAGLSKPEVEEMVLLIKKINASGVAILIIEHIIPLLLAVSDRLLVLNYGEVLAQGTPNEIVRNEKVVEAFIGTALNE